LYESRVLNAVAGRFVHIVFAINPCELVPPSCVIAFVLVRQQELLGCPFFPQITLGLAYGVNNNILDKGTYGPVVTKAWQGTAHARAEVAGVAMIATGVCLAV
jgi:hypothetical protein